MKIIKSGYQGIWLPEAGVLMDGSPHPKMTKATSSAVIISHAHADHMPRNRNATIISTPPTASLLRFRGHRGPIHELSFGKTLSLPKADITLYPAGHILGSAMIFVESEEGSLLYTGDCRNPPSPVSEGFQLPDQRVDWLVIEATFGLPLFKWPEYEELFDILRSFVIRTLHNGQTPVLYGYSLGKTQEIMHILAGCSESPVMQVHGSAVRLCQIYEEFGFNLGRWEPYCKDTLDGKVLVTPVSSAGTEMIQRIRKRSTAYISGWACLESRASHLQTDLLVPLSDHIDFFELLSLCRLLSPRQTVFTHSADPSVVMHFLHQEGLNCSTLETEFTHG